MNILNSYRHIRPKKVKYPIPEIPDDSGKKSGTDWVLAKIIGSGRVSGTRQALLMTTIVNHNVMLIQFILKRCTIVWMIIMVMTMILEVLVMVMAIVMMIVTVIKMTVMMFLEMLLVRSMISCSMGLRPSIFIALCKSCQSLSSC